jgi:hypothetical protein
MTEHHLDVAHRCRMAIHMSRISTRSPYSMVAIADALGFNVMGTWLRSNPTVYDTLFKPQDAS